MEMETPISCSVDKPEKIDSTTPVDIPTMTSVKLLTDQIVEKEDDQIEKETTCPKTKKVSGKPTLKSKKRPTSDHKDSAGDKSETLEIPSQQLDSTSTQPAIPIEPEQILSGELTSPIENKTKQVEIPEGVSQKTERKDSIDIESVVVKKKVPGEIVTYNVPEMPIRKPSLPTSDILEKVTIEIDKRKKIVQPGQVEVSSETIMITSRAEELTDSGEPLETDEQLVIPELRKGSIAKIDETVDRTQSAITIESKQILESEELTSSIEKQPESIAPQLTSNLNQPITIQETQSIEIGQEIDSCETPSAQPKVDITPSHSINVTSSVPGESEVTLEQPIKPEKKKLKKKVDLKKQRSLSIERPVTMESTSDLPESDQQQINAQTSLSEDLNASGTASTLISTTLEAESDLVLTESHPETVKPTIGDTQAISIGIDVLVENEQQLTDQVKPEKKKIKAKKSLIKSRSASIERQQKLDKEEELDLEHPPIVSASPSLVPQKTIESETTSTLEGVSFQLKETPIPEKKARETIERDLMKKASIQQLTLIGGLVKQVEPNRQLDEKPIRKEIIQTFKRDGDKITSVQIESTQYEDSIVDIPMDLDDNQEQQQQLAHSIIEEMPTQIGQPQQSNSTSTDQDSVSIELPDEDDYQKSESTELIPDDDRNQIKPLSESTKAKPRFSERFKIDKLQNEGTAVTELEVDASPKKTDSKDDFIVEEDVRPKMGTENSPLVIEDEVFYAQAVSKPKRVHFSINDAILLPGEAPEETLDMAVDNLQGDITIIEAPKQSESPVKESFTLPGQRKPKEKKPSVEVDSESEKIICPTTESDEVTIAKPVITEQEKFDEENIFRLKKRPSFETPVESEFTLKQTSSEKSPGSPVEEKVKLTDKPKSQTKRLPVEVDGESEKVSLQKPKTVEATIKTSVIEEKEKLEAQTKFELTLTPTEPKKHSELNVEQSFTIPSKPEDEEIKKSTEIEAESQKVILPATQTVEATIKKPVITEDEETEFKFKQRRPSDKSVESEFTLKPTQTTIKPESSVEEILTIPVKPKAKESKQVVEIMAETQKVILPATQAVEATIKKPVITEDEETEFKVKQRRSSEVQVESEFTLRPDQIPEKEPVEESFTIQKKTKPRAKRPSIEMDAKPEKVIIPSRRESVEYKVTKEEAEITVKKPIITDDEETEFKFTKRRSSDKPVESEFTLKQTESIIETGSPVEESFTIQGKPKPRAKRPSIEMDSKSEKVILPSRKESVEYRVIQEDAEMTLKKIVSEEEYHQRKKSEDYDARVEFSHDKSSGSGVEDELTLRRDSTRSTSSVEDKFPPKAPQKLKKKSAERKGMKQTIQLEEKSVNAAIKMQSFEDEEVEFKFKQRRSSEGQVESEFTLTQSQQTIEPGKPVEESFTIPGKTKPRLNRPSVEMDAESAKVILPSRRESVEYKVTKEEADLTIRKVVSQEEYEKSSEDCELELDNAQSSQSTLRKDSTSSTDIRMTILEAPKKSKLKESQKNKEAMPTDERIEPTITKPVTTEDEETEFKFTKRRSSEKPVESEFTLKQTESIIEPGSPVEESFTLPGKPKPRAKRPSIEMDSKAEKVIIPSRRESAEYKVTKEEAEVTVKKVVSQEEYEKSITRKKSEDSESSFGLSIAASSQSTIEAELSLRRDSIRSTGSVEAEVTVSKAPRKSKRKESKTIKDGVPLTETESVEATIKKPVITEDEETEFKFKQRRPSDKPVESEFTLKQTESIIESGSPVEESFTIQGKPKPRGKRLPFEIDAQSDKVILPSRRESVEYKVTSEEAEMTIKKVVSQEEYEKTMRRKKSEHSESSFGSSLLKSSQSSVEADTLLRRDSTCSNSSVDGEFQFKSKSRKSIDSRTSHIESTMEKSEIEDDSVHSMLSTTAYSQVSESGTISNASLSSNSRTSIEVSETTQSTRSVSGGQTSQSIITISQTSWMRETNVDPVVRSYVKHMLLTRNEYFFKISIFMH